MTGLNQIHILARAVIIADNHILLAYDPRANLTHYYEFNKKFYYLPGGHVEFQESAQKAVVREIFEETGYQAIIESYLGMLEHAWHFPGDEACCHTHEINLIFKLQVKDLKSHMHISQKEDHVAFNWININELQNTDLRPIPLRTLIPKWLKATTNNSYESTIL